MTIPSSVPAGSYYVGMIVDTTNAVDESDKTNNFRYDPDRISIAGLPDIAPLIYEQPTSATARTSTITNAVRNIGAAPAGAFVIEFYASNDTAFTTDDTRIGYRNVAALDVGAATPTEQTSMTLSRVVPGGSYYIIMVIDFWNAVAEVNENNNVVTTGTPITIPGISDFVLDTYARPANPAARTFTITNTVRNSGDASAGTFSVGFYLSEYTIIMTSDTLIGARTIGYLAAGAVTPDEHTTVTIPDTVTAGSYYLGLIIDTTDAVAEANEANNVYCDGVLTPLPGPTRTQAPTQPPGVLTVPGGTGVPTWITIIGTYDDVNGNGRKNFADVVLFFNQMT